jgi:hypothetical protein
MNESESFGDVVMLNMHVMPFDWLGKVYQFTWLNWYISIPPIYGTITKQSPLNIQQYQEISYGSGKSYLTTIKLLKKNVSFDSLFEKYERVVHLH